MNIINICLSLIKENGEYSLTRLQSAIGYVVFLVGSCYLIYTDHSWGNYDTFAIVTGGASTASQIANKYLNSKYNTPLGESGKPSYSPMNNSNKYKTIGGLNSTNSDDIE